MPNIRYAELDYIKNKIEEKLDIKRETTNAKIEAILSYWENEMGVGEPPPISKRTLTRIWSEYTERKKPNGSIELNTNTIDSLIQIIENESTWNEYKKRFNSKISDVLFNPKSIVVSKLSVADEVVIGWKPIYYYDVIYLGNSEFKIQGSNEVGRQEQKFRAEAFLIDFECRYTFDLDNMIGGYPLPRIVCVNDIRDIEIISKDGIYNHPDSDNSDDIFYL